MFRVVILLNRRRIRGSQLDIEIVFVVNEITRIIVNTLRPLIAIEKEQKYEHEDVPEQPYLFLPSRVLLILTHLLAKERKKQMQCIVGKLFIKEHKYPKSQHPKSQHPK